jgi:hypothetical protein
VLESRGWTIVRMWSTDWFRDRAGTLDRLKRTLSALYAQLEEEDSKRAQATPLVPETAISADSPVASSDFGAGRPYIRPRLPGYALAHQVDLVSGSLADASPSIVARHVSNIVNQEAPVHIEDIIQRLLYIWQHERRGTRLVAAAEAGIKHAVSRQLVVRRGDFLYNDQPIQARNRSGMGIGPERIAPEELVEAARLVLAATDCFEEDELTTEIREVLGLRRTQEGAKPIQDAIRTLIQEGTVVHGSEGLRLRPTTAGQPDAREHPTGQEPPTRR